MEYLCSLLLLLLSSPNLFPRFQDSADTLVCPSSAPPSATNRPHPCSSPALVQCMFYSHEGSSDCCLNSPGQRLRCHSGFYMEEPFLVNASHVCSSVKLLHKPCALEMGRGSGMGLPPRQLAASHRTAVFPLGLLSEAVLNPTLEMAALICQM